MNKLIQFRRGMNLLLLIGCLLIIIPYEIFAEVQSLHLNHDEPAAALIRMINFFDVTHLSEQPAEIMYIANVITSTDQGVSLFRLSSYTRHKVHTVKQRVKNSDKRLFIPGVILLFFIFYQSSRTSSETAPRISELIMA